MRPPRISRPAPGEVDPLAFDEPASQEHGLEEVEHALSALAGRHPEHVRLEREDAARADRRRRELARQVVEERKKRRVRLAKQVLAIAALVSAGVLVRAHVLDIRAARTWVDAPAKTYASVGFAAFPDGWATASYADASIPAGNCVAIVAGDSKGPVDVDVERDGVATHAHGSVGFCTCATEKVTANAPGSAVRILRRSASDFGGTLGFSLRAVKPSVLVDSPCAEEQLDAYMKTQASDLGAAASALEGPALAYAPIGYRPLASEVGGAPFAIVPAPENSCVLAFGAEPISLRLTGGNRPVKDVTGPIGFCTKKATLFSVWRSGATPIQVAVADAAKSGGLYGMRETAAAEKASLATWIAAEDLPWDAANALRASAVVQVSELDPEAAGKMPIPSTRLFALSTIDDATVAPDASQDTIFFSCAPPLENVTSTICVEAAPQRLHATTPRGAWGAASAALPFWMAGFTQAHEPGVVPVQAELLALARKLVHRGFEPTILGAIKETERGAEILGRAGEDAIVAVGAAPQAPWAVPYTDGPAWSLDGEPRVVPLAPGARVSLTPPAGSAAQLRAPLDARRTIVFRHSTTTEKK